MLNKIIVEKREEVEQRKRNLPLSTLKERIVQRKAPLDFASALKSDDTHSKPMLKMVPPLSPCSPRLITFKAALTT